MKKKLSSDQNLMHMDAKGILLHSRGLSGLNNDELAAQMGIGEETVARYQRESAEGEYRYELPIGRIPLWCKATGNYLVPQWIAQRCGGVFVRVDEKSTADMSISENIRRLNAETTQAVNELMRDLCDNEFCGEDMDRLLKELMDVRLCVEQAITVVKSGKMVR